MRRFQGSPSGHSGPGPTCRRVANDMGTIVQGVPRPEPSRDDCLSFRADARRERDHPVVGRRRWLA